MHRQLLHSHFKSALTGKTLLNLDTEDWGEIFVGCAGGGDTTVRLPCALEPAASSGSSALQLQVSGEVWDSGCRQTLLHCVPLCWCRQRKSRAHIFSSLLLWCSQVCGLGNTAHLLRLPVRLCSSTPLSCSAYINRPWIAEQPADVQACWAGTLAST